MNDDNGMIDVSQGSINIVDVRKEFASKVRRVVALDGVSLSVREGELLCLVGPSGCGKSTLLRMLAGLETASSGTVDFDLDHDGRPLRAMVFQEQGVFPWMSVLDNAAYGLRVGRTPRKEREARANEYLLALGLDGFQRMFPRQLSGGMRQRVNVARAFAVESAVLLMDEPFGSLDAQTRMVVQYDFLRLWRERKKTVVFVTHDIDEAIFLADRVVVMTKRPGQIKTIIDVGLPRPRDIRSLYDNPEFGRIRALVWKELSSEIPSLEGVT